MEPNGFLNYIRRANVVVYNNDHKEKVELIFPQFGGTYNLMDTVQT